MLSYEKPNLSDLDAITALYCRFLNSGAAVRDYIREGLENPAFVGVKCVDTEKNLLVGIVSMRPGIEFTCGHEELVKEIRDRWGTEGVYTGDMLVVLPEYMGQGIGRKLSVLADEELKRRGVRYLVKEEWRRATEADVPAYKAMSHFGNRVVVSDDPHFYKDLPKYGLTCPKCGANCTCGAIVSVVEL